MTTQTQKNSNPLAIALGFSFAVPLIAWYLGAFVFFGQAAFILLLLCVFSPFFITIFASAASNHKDSNMSRTEILSLVGGSALAVGLVCTTPFNLSLKTERAIMKSEIVAEMMGRDPQVKSQLAGIENWQEAKKNLSLINVVNKSTIQKDAVSSYLASAKTMKTDTSFVVENGMVRERDEAELYNMALEMARMGNENAIAFLAKR